MNLKRKLSPATYTTTKSFAAIPQHAAVCFDDDESLVAVTGPSGDQESEAYAALFALAPGMAQVLTGLKRRLRAGPISSDSERISLIAKIDSAFNLPFAE